MRRGTGQASRADDKGFSALVCCGEDWWHYSAIFSRLHRAGIELDLIAPRRSLAALSRYYSRLFATDSMEDTVATLKARLSARGYDWVHVGDEPTLLALERHRGEPWAAEIFPISPGHLCFEVLFDKNALLSLLERIGIPTLAGRFAADEAAARAGAVALGLPIAVKLRVGHAGAGVFRVDTAEQLEAVLARVRDEYPLRLEPWIDRPVGGTLALFARGQLLAWTSSLAGGRWPRPAGPSCSRRVFNHALIESGLRAFGAATSYHGLCHPEWMLMPDGTLAYLEINPRGACLIRHDHFDGVDFARAFAAFAGREAYQQPQQRSGPQGPMIDMFPQHLIYCLQSREFRSLRRWLPLLGTHDIPWDDPGPTLGAFRMVGFRAADEVRAWLEQRGSPA